MGYSLQPDVALRNRGPASSFRTPKTLTPGSRLQQRGRRYYSAEVGRWVNRDPIGEWGGLALYLYCLNRPVETLDLLGLLSCTATLDAEWTSGPRVQNVNVHSLTGSVGIDIVQNILFATTFPPRPRPDVNISVSAQIEGEITGELQCSAFCSCEHNGLVVEAGAKWYTIPTVNLDVSGSFAYSQTWSQTISDLVEGNQKIGDAALAFAPCSVVPTPAGKALCYVAKAAKKAVLVARLSRWLNNYAKLRDGAGKVMCLASLFGVTEFDVKVSHDVSWYMFDTGSTTVLEVDVTF